MAQPRWSGRRSATYKPGIRGKRTPIPDVGRAVEPRRATGVEAVTVAGVTVAAEVGAVVAEEAVEIKGGRDPLMPSPGGGMPKATTKGRGISPAVTPQIIRDNVSGLNATMRLSAR